MARRNTTAEETRADLDRHLVGTVGRLRADVAHIQGALARLTTASGLSGTAARAAAGDARAELDAVRAEEAPKIEGHLDVLTELVDTHPALCEEYGDAVERMRNHWNDAVRTFPATGTATKEVTDALGRLVLETAYVVIPYRLRAKLATYWPGQSLDVREAFNDHRSNYPDDVIRQVVGYLAAHPRLVSGIVDTERMVVHRASPRSSRRASSVAFVVALTVLGVVVATLVGDRAGTFGLPAMRGGDLRGAYLLAVAGAVGHVVIVALKQVREESATSRFVSIDNWLLWLHVRELKVIASVFAIWIATYATVAGMKKIPDGTTMLLAGYTADSIADLVLPKFTASVAKRAAALRTTLGGKDPEPAAG